MTITPIVETSQGRAKGFAPLADANSLPRPPMRTFHFRRIALISRGYPRLGATLPLVER